MIRILRKKLGGEDTSEDGIIGEDTCSSDSVQEESDLSRSYKGKCTDSGDDMDLRTLAAELRNKENQYVAKDKTTIWYRSNNVSKFNKANKKDFIKILPGPMQCAADLTDENI